MMAEIIYGSAFSPFTFLHQENIYAHLLSHRGDKVQVPVTLTLKVWLTIMKSLVTSNPQKAPIIMDAFSLRRGSGDFDSLGYDKDEGEETDE